MYPCCIKIGTGEELITEVFLEVEPFEGDLEGEWKVQLGWWKGRTPGLRVRHLEQLATVRDGNGVDGTRGLRRL